jgi:DNA-binding transcriptional LysR family regulator
VSIETIDLNLLRVLDTVLRERSVARAAQRLHVTPSAISNALARLRSALGDPLVTRRGRGIVPTPRALELGPRLSGALAELEAAVAPGTFDAASCTRSFTLAMADGLQMAWLPRIAARLHAKMPRAALRVVGIDTLLALGDLSSSDVDLHVGARASGPGVHTEHLCEEPTVLVMRRKHPGNSVKLGRERLEKLGHVAVELAPGRGIRDPVSAAYARAGVKRRVALTVSSFSVAAAVAGSTDLVATIPRSLFLTHGPRFRLVMATGQLPKHEVSLSLCWHERTHRDLAHIELRALVADAIRAIPPG